MTKAEAKAAVDTINAEYVALTCGPHNSDSKRSSDPMTALLNLKIQERLEASTRARLEEAVRVLRSFDEPATT